MADSIVRKPVFQSELFGNFSLQIYNVWNGAAIAANEAKAVELDFYYEGYYPLGIVGYKCEGTYSTFINISCLCISSAGVGPDLGSMHFTGIFRNIKTDQTSNPRINIWVLWYKVQ